MMKKAPGRRMQNVFIEFIADGLPAGAIIGSGNCPSVAC